jgi:hypothetical protein
LSFIIYASSTSTISQSNTHKDTVGVPKSITRHENSHLDIGSPILDSIPIQHKPVYFNVTLFSDSIYRQDASPEVHQAWLDLGLAGKSLPSTIFLSLIVLRIATQVIPETDADRVGFTQGMVKLRDSEGGGFIAQMEVFHNLHCLDTLRQGLYFNYDYYHKSRDGVWGRSDAVVRKHMGMTYSRILQLRQVGGLVIKLTTKNRALPRPS